MSHHDQAKPHHTFNPLEDVSFGEGIDLAVGLTATALTADQLAKLAHTKKHTTEHLVKSGLTAGLAATAFAMLAREHREKHEKQQHKKEQHQRRHSLVERPHPHFLSDNDSDDDRDGRAVALARPRPHSRRSSSTHSTYSEHFRRQDPAQRRSPSPAPSTRGRALSHPPARDRTFAESHPHLISFVEAVGNNLRDGNHR